MVQLWDEPPAPPQEAGRWETYDLRACVDCLHFVANGTIPEHGDWQASAIQHHWPAVAGWRLAAGDAENEAFNADFSWGACRCCGSSLGGSRHHLVAMRELRCEPA